MGPGRSNSPPARGRLRSGRLLSATFTGISMNTRWSRIALGVVTVVVALAAGAAWAIHEGLAPSQDDWKLKFEVQVTPADDKLTTIDFKLLDEGRLKPLHAVNVISLGPTKPNGTREYKVNARFELKPTSDGKRAGQLQIPSEYVEGAFLHFLAKRVDGRPRQGYSAAYYDIPLKKFAK